MQRIFFVCVIGLIIAIATMLIYFITIEEFLPKEINVNPGPIQHPIPFMGAKIPKVVISLTTIPDRMNNANFHKVLDSLVFQRYAHSVILNLPRYSQRFQIPYPDCRYVPKITGNESASRFLVNRCTDWGPATKLLGLVENDLHREFDYVIIIDDDRRVHDTFCADLIKTVIFHKSNLPRVGYLRLDIQHNPNIEEGLNVSIPWGAAGIIIPSALLDSRILREFQQHESTCRYVDDVFFFLYFGKHLVQETTSDRKFHHMGIEINGSKPLYKHTNRNGPHGLNIKCFMNMNKQVNFPSSITE
jgi:hypothetical protein